MSNRAFRLLLATAAVMVGVGLVAGIWGAMSTEPPRTVESVLNEYETEYAALRERLADVPAMVPSEKVEGDSCEAATPLDPEPAYHPAESLIFDGLDGNTAIITAETLADLDATVDGTGAFAVSSPLLDALRLTGPRGPLGDQSYVGPFGRDMGSSLYSDDARALMEHGLQIRYLLVLNVIEFEPPTTSYWSEGGIRGWGASVAADAHLVDLATTEVRCSFAVAESNFSTYVSWLEGGSWHNTIYQELVDRTICQATDELQALTGSTAIEFSEECLRRLQLEDEIDDD